ncbi:hypothetical protein MMC30_005396 [Trapelia coarctata]|nr:hypothetical protein [Trapelia coarctata]
MVSHTGHLPESRLRAVTQRLALTPNKRLPQLVPFLADTITGCREILSTSEGRERGKDDSELGVLVHKLKTQLSTLLLEKSVEARWSAAVLIKATIEVGGWDILQGSGGWTRGLLGILNRPDSTATKRLCIITLTRIFLLTQGRQSLLREITTPSIPPFVTSCLNIISLRRSAQEARIPDLTSPLLDTVLQALTRLVPHHPSSFRPFVAQIRSVLGPLLAPTPSSLPTEAEKEAIPSSVPKSAVVLAQHLYALLPQCAPKNSSNEEWGKSVKDTVTQIHRTADRVFRAVSEEWSSLARPLPNQAQADTYDGVLSDSVAEPIGLPSWRGIEAGCERLIGLLHLLESHIAAESSSTYTLTAGVILSTVERLLSVTVPPTSSSQKTGDQARINPEVGREEREGMWLGLPHIHIASTAVLTTLIKRLGDVSNASAQGALEQLMWVFQRERDHPEIRRSIYEAVIEILAIVGPSMPRSTVSSLSPLIRALCVDALPESNQPEMTSRPSTNEAKKPPNTSVTATNADSYLQPQDKISIATEPVNGVRNAAAVLLPLILSKVSQAHVSVPVRSLIDRTAILTKNEKAMLASVLNPPEGLKGKQISSILPLYARNSAVSLEMEGLLRPRMPGLQQNRNANGTLDADQEEDEDVEMDSSFAGYQRAADEKMSGTDTVQGHEETAVPLNPRVPATDGRMLGQMMAVDAGMESSSSFNLGSPKRTRAADESELPIEGPRLGSALPASKRARVDQEVVHTEEWKVSPDPLPEHSPVATTQAVTVHHSVTISEHIASARHGATDGDESDGSFEIPPIILDSDSDEVEEEEEDGSEA